MEDERKLTIKKIYSTEEDMNADTETVFEKTDLAFVPATKTMYEKVDGKFVKFNPPVDATLREDNNMIIVFNDMNEFTHKVGFVPANSRVYVRESNAIWKQGPNEEGCTFEGTPESLGLTIKDSNSVIVPDVAAEAEESAE